MGTGSATRVGGGGGGGGAPPPPARGGPPPPPARGGGARGRAPPLDGVDQSRAGPCQPIRMKEVGVPQISRYTTPVDSLPASIIMPLPA